MLNADAVPCAVVMAKKFKKINEKEKNLSAESFLLKFSLKTIFVRVASVFNFFNQRSRELGLYDQWETEVS